jgi:hypothetical protein
MLEKADDKRGRPSKRAATSDSLVLDRLIVRNVRVVSNAVSNVSDVVVRALLATAAAPAVIWIARWLADTLTDVFG